MLHRAIFIYLRKTENMRFPVLHRSPLFRGLNEGEIGEMVGSVNYRLRFYHSGALAALAGDEISALMIVVAGSFRGEMSDTEGRIMKIEDINPPNALAAALLFADTPRYPVNVTANSDSELLIIYKEDYLNLMIRDRRIMENYLAFTCSKTQFLTGRLRFHSMHSIRGKLAHYLTTLPGAALGRVVIDRSQQELADYFGVTRPSLARVMRELASQGVISLRRREVTLLDTRALTRLADT